MTALQAMRIATGTVFDEYGGVSQHIFNIRQFSCHQISILPSNLMSAKICSSLVESGRLSSSFLCL